MTEIHTNLNNFSDSDLLLEIFPKSNDYEFTSKKVFALKKNVTCSCGCKMVHNGYDYARKSGFGKVRIGKQLCTNCGKQHHEDKSFWKKLLLKWAETITAITLILRDASVAWKVVSKIMSFLIPCGKDKLRYLFNRTVEQFKYPQGKFLIVLYDEQHPKRGRAQRFRLTLLDYETRSPIADELFDNKDEETIESFLRKHLNVDEKLIIVTDCDRRYPEIFKRVWGNKVIHQKCLLHLNKLVVKDFGKNASLVDEYNKYRILNIFYNRDRELKVLDRLIKKQEKMSFASTWEKKGWIRKAKRSFYKYVKTLENARRRKGKRKNIMQRELFKAEQLLEELWQQRNLFPKKVKARIEMIKKNWQSFTAFYHVKSCPATNNALENFYSTSLKTHRKKQLRSDVGLINQMKLSALKRAEGFPNPKSTLLEIFGLVRLIVS